MIYNRPTRSGTYAFISVFQPWRIGLNKIDYTYAIDDKARKDRYELVLDAYKAMMTRLEGAMTTTRLPHFENIEGLKLGEAKNAMPVPCDEPISDGYVQRDRSNCRNAKHPKSRILIRNNDAQEIDKLKTALLTGSGTLKKWFGSAQDTDRKYILL